MSPFEERSRSHPVPKWRIAAGIVVLSGLLLTGGMLAPVYLRNRSLQRFLQGTPVSSDDALKRQILDQARALDLDVPPDHLQIRHIADGHRTAVLYVVRVSLPLYTVNLHFSSDIAGGN